MTRVDLVLLVALAGCRSIDSSGGDLVGDAAVDAEAAVLADAVNADAAVGPGTCFLGTAVGSVPLMPFTTTGTTPAGSLDDVQFIRISFMGGSCPGTYSLELYRTTADSIPVVRFDVTLPPNATQPPTGTIAASACTLSGGTDGVNFEIVQLDIPPINPQQPTMLRIAGRMTINSGPWNVDFTVDATTPNAICLLL
jgi:hypothetical protein